MKRRFCAILAGVLAVCIGSSYAAQQPIFVKLKTDRAEKSAAIKTLEEIKGVAGVEFVVRGIEKQEHPLGNWVRVTAESQQKQEVLLYALKKISTIEVAEILPVRMVEGNGELDGIPNDPLLGFQWYLDKVNAYAAWDLVDNANGVVVAVVDNGVYRSHVDLSSVLWKNQAEVNGSNGVDDDHNGFVDDKYGWDTYDWDGDPNAPEDVASNGSHGTHCAGIIGAGNDNGRGIAGIAPGVTVMAVRAGEGRNIYNSADAILYAADNGADVISMSFSGQIESVYERDVLRYAAEKGIILVAAAGNEGQTVVNYPAGYEMVIGVGATNAADRLAGFSSRGWWVDVSAPGVEILSTVIGGYAYMDGTSMATPLVAGICGLIKAQKPETDVYEAKAQLTTASRGLQSDTDGTPGGRVDAWRTLLADKPTVIVRGATYAENDSQSDDDGVIEVHESGTVVLDLELVGREAESLAIQLSGIDQKLVTSATQSWSNQQTGKFSTNPLHFYVNERAEWGNTPLNVFVNADGFRDTLVVRVPVEPHWATHETENMLFSVTDFGAIGYRDYLHNLDVAEGVRLKEAKHSLLFLGSIMIQNGDVVSDNADERQREFYYGFETIDNGGIHPVENAEGLQIFKARYSDMHAIAGARVVVDQTTTSDPEGDDVVYAKYEVSPLNSRSDLVFGLYLDWDIWATGANSVAYDPSLKLHYMKGRDGAAGVMLLITDSYRSVLAQDNAAVTYDGYSDSEKIEAMNAGTSNAASINQKDYASVVSVDMENVTFDHPGIVEFAYIAADTEEELLALAERVAQNGKHLEGEGSAEISGYSIEKSWPNPFNAQTIITVSIPENTQDAAVEIYNLLGERVKRLSVGNVLAGKHRFTWNGDNESGADAASGTYYARLVVNGKKEATAKKLILLR